MKVSFLRKNDIEDILKIYQYYIENTNISFEYKVPDLKSFKKRSLDISKKYPFIVYKKGDLVIGYAYASSHRSREAYQWSIETSIYLLHDFHGKGIAKVLYNNLLLILKKLGYHNAYAGITLPNIKSEKFHQKFGFEEIGTYKKVGYKLGKWHDVKWYCLSLSNNHKKPNEPILIDQIDYDFIH